MKTRADFQNMFEPADAGFEDAVRRALRGVKRYGASAPRKKLRVGLVFAVLLCLLLAAAALAAAFRWGVLDFVTGQGKEAKVLPEATEMIQDAPDIEQTGGKLTDVSFSVRQAVYDGSQIYMVVEVVPGDGGTLLIDDWNTPSDPASYIDSGRVDDGKTIAQYAKERGKARILAASVSPVGDWPGDGGGYGSSSRMEEDGTLAFMIEGDCKQGEEAAFTLRCSIVPFEQADSGWTTDDRAGEKAELSFTLRASESFIGSVRNTKPVDYPLVGVRVDSLTMTGTPMAVYYRIEYTVVDAEKLAADGLTFAFLDENGAALPPGAGAPGAFEPVEGMDYVEGEDKTAGWKEIARSGSLNAMEVMPNAVTLAACDSFGNTIREAHEIRLK